MPKLMFKQKNRKSTKKTILHKKFVTLTERRKFGMDCEKNSVI